MIVLLAVFACKNEKADNEGATENFNDETGYTKGIGLKNVKRRLELIYKDQYDLRIVNEETHLIILKIKLS